MSLMDRILLSVVLTLCMVVLGVVGALISAIFDPAIPNEPLLAIIAPAFSAIIGGFIGLISGIHIGKKEDETE
jgi:hypothetical protein